MSLQEFHDAGLLWLANRALHPFGIALSVVAAVEEGMQIDMERLEIVEDAGLRPMRTSDPLGIVFTEEQEDRSRTKFFRWLAERGSADDRDWPNEGGNE